MTDEKLLNTYVYGSYVYGTFNKDSDIDYIFVVENQKKDEFLLSSNKCNVISCSLNYFQEQLNNHSVSAVECFFLPEKFKVELYNFSFLLDKTKLRKSFSKKASNSWVKAKKKIDIHNEYYIGMKSLFHSLRILVFGIQIANENKINYKIANGYWNKIKEQDFKEWKRYKDYWQKEYNMLKSEFKKVCPME